MLRVRQIFDGLIHDVPRPYLSADVQIVHDKVFERAVVKLQRGDNLTQQEAAALEMFKIPVGTATAAADTVISNSYFQTILQTQDDAQKQRKVAAQYESTAHVSPTSNICEFLFSRAKLVMRPRRRLMDPSTLETLLMLRMNK